MKKFTRKSVYAGILIILILIQIKTTIAGFVGLSLLDCLPFIENGLVHYGVFFLGALLVFLVLNGLSRRRFYLTTLILFSLVIILSTGFEPILILFLVSLSFIGLGKKIRPYLFLSKLDIGIDLLVGAGVIGTFIGFSVHLPINFPALYQIALFIPIFLSRKALAEGCQQLSDNLLADRSVTRAERWAEILIASIAMLYIAVGLMPEFGHDALAMHLVQPMYIDNHHYWPFDVSWHLMAVMPMLGNWLCTLVFLLAGETGVKLFVTGFVFLSAHFIFVFTSRHWGRPSALLSVLCFLSCPVIFLLGSSVFMEAFWSAFLLSAIFLLTDTIETETDQNPLPLSCLLIGFAVSCKLIPLLIFPAIMAGILFCWKLIPRLVQVRSILAGAVCFGLAAAQPYIVAWLKTGNPVFPFFNAIFRSAYYPIKNFDNSLFHQGLGLDTLYRTVFESQQYLEASMGAAGFTWLLMLPMAVFWVLVKKDRRLIFLGVIGLCFCWAVFLNQSYLRYIMPVFGIAAILVAVGIKQSYELSLVTKGISLLLFGISIILNILFLPSSSWVYRDFPINLLWSDHISHFTTNAPQRAAINFVNTLPSAGGTVAVIGHPIIAGLKSDKILIANAYNESFWKSLIEAENADQLLEIFKNYQIETLIVSDDISNNPNVKNKRFKIKNKRLKSLLFQVTWPMVSFADVSVRKIRDDFLFKNDLLTDGSLEQKNGFHLFGDAHYLTDSRGLKVTLDSPATQNVNVIPGRRYRLKALLSCFAESSEGRLQVNWLDQAGAFIYADIVIVACDSEVVNQMDVTAPQMAATAVIYAAGHTEKPVIFNRLWFFSEW